VQKLAIASKDDAPKFALGQKVITASPKQPQSENLVKKHEKEMKTMTEFKLKILEK
jgi:hypothetical protein